MGFRHTDVLQTRKLRMDYVSPPICEADFTGTGEPTVVLSPLTALLPPSGLWWELRGAFFRLHWSAYPGAICYTIWRVIDPNDPDGEYEIYLECIDSLFYDLPAGTYRITVILPEGETPPSEEVELGETAPPVPNPEPEDYCSGETDDKSAVPLSFATQVHSYDVDLPAPSIHMNFDAAYIPNLVNVADWPEGAGWDLNVEWISGNWNVAGDPTYGTLYSVYGLRMYRNGAPYGIRLASCSLTSENEAALEAFLGGGGESFFFLESTLPAGDTYGLAIDLNHTSFNGTTTGSIDPVSPYYDPSLLCSRPFIDSNPAPVSDLRMRVTWTRNLSPPWSVGKIDEWDTVKEDFTLPAIVPGLPFLDPFTFGKASRLEAEYAGSLPCQSAWENGWIQSAYVAGTCEPSVTGYMINGWRVDNVACYYSDRYVDLSGVLRNTPAWVMMVEVRDTRWGANFLWWAGVKLVGLTPTGTYYLWNRYPFNLVAGGRLFTNPYQTEMLCKAPCLRVSAVS